MMHLPFLLAVALLSPQGAQENLYHGFVRHDFKVGGVDAVVVEPKVAAKERPWIWRCEFFDHRPMLDLALLEKGYHLVYLNVGNTFGAPVPMAQFGKLYQELVGPQWHLNKRLVLEGFSRGGLYAYNWAAKNPNKVMAIYGDAPVCDFRTWPYGGQGATRSDDDWKALVSSYGFPSEQAALDYPFNPVDDLEVLAKARIPIIHVVGDADEVVPLKANTAIVEARYKALGGVIEVIHKPGGLHHPHSLDDPTPLARFLEKHANDTKRCPSSTLLAAPNLESRYNSAGWNGRSWLDQFEDGKRAAHLPSAELALVGDSITQGFGGPERQVYEIGKEGREKWLGNLANLGISGDRVQHVLWRIEHGALDGSPVKQVLVMIGINNYPEDTPDEVVRGIQHLSDVIRHRLPSARVAIEPIMPAGQQPNSPIRLWCDQVNKGLSELSAKHRIRLAFTDHNYLLNADGTQNADMVSGDGVHCKASGYEAWAQKIKTFLDKK